MRAADFAKHKEMHKADIGRDKMSCEEEAKICFDLNPAAATGGQRPSMSKHLTAQFVNVKGRVVIVYGVAVGPTAEVAKVAKRVADTFSALLIQENP